MISLFHSGSRNIGIKDLSFAITGHNQMYDICFNLGASSQDGIRASKCQANVPQPLGSPQSGLLQQLSSKAGEFRKVHQQIRKNENANKYTVCSLCKRRVRKQMIAAHIYSKHIQKSDTLKCNYCGFGVSYNSYRMKVHMKQKHRGLNPGAYTNACSEMTDVYLAWRKQCFPDVGKTFLGRRSRILAGPGEREHDEDMTARKQNID